MNFIDHNRRHNFHLLGRNEGKLKSYESCTDIRAWSHDLRRRNQYLREWIKCDMPLCILPVSTLAGFLRIMTCRRNSKSSARCHSDCKSKIVLETIIAQCNAMKECLRADANFEKFFIEEDIETSHWPCENCLEALKIIRLFWRILLEKVFLINLKKNESIDNTMCAANSFRDVVRNWGTEITQEIKFIRSITPELQRSNFGDTCVKKISSCHILTPCSEGDTCKENQKSCGSKKSTKNCTHLLGSLLESSSQCNIQKRCSRHMPCLSSTSIKREYQSSEISPNLSNIKPKSKDSIRPMPCLSSTSIKREYQTSESSPNCFNIKRKSKDCIRPKSCSAKCQTRKCSAGCPNVKHIAKDITSKFSEQKKCSPDCPNIKRTKKDSTSNSSIKRNCSSKLMHKGSSKCSLHSISHSPPLRPSKDKVHVCTSACTSACMRASTCKSAPASKKTIRNNSNKVNSVKQQTTAACCSTTRESPEVRAIRANMECLQNQFTTQKQEMEKLKKENRSLKCELQNLQKSCKWKSIYKSQQASRPEDDFVTTLVPKPFECCIDSSSSTNLTKDAESELIITMKNCKHECYRHVNLLQILHKSNNPCFTQIKQDSNCDGPCYKNEDPVHLLQKVQTTLGAMVTREMLLARQRRCTSNSEIAASFQRVSGTKSVPSRSSIPSRCTLNSRRSQNQIRYCMR